MEDHETDLDALEEQFAGLEETFGGLGGVAAAFRKELQGLQSSFESSGREASGMFRSVTSSVKRAFDDVVFGGARLTDALAALGSSISGSVLNKAVAPLQNALGSSMTGGLEAILGGLLPFHKGAAFSSGRVAAFARGGVVGEPTRFPMRGGMGLMGEAGPEAIMPLARGADGKLGVRGGGGGSVNVTMNITTPDVTGFQQSRSQIAAEMSRALQRGRRNL